MSSKGMLKLTALSVITVGVAFTALAGQGRTAPRKAETAISGASEPARKANAASAIQTNNVSLEIVCPPGASFGVPVDYELVVRNQGNNSVENVRVEAELPQGTEFLSAAPTAQVESETATWVLDRLEAGRERRLKMQLRPMNEGTLECHAMVTCMALSAIQTVVTRPQLALEMTGPREIIIGQPAAFTLKISNPGSGPATNVMVRNLVPAGFEHPAGDEIEYEVGTLPPGETREVRLELTAKTAGVQVNHSEITADGGLSERAEASVRVLEPQLAVKNTGPKKRYLERPATYSIEVSNPGTAKTSKISVLDEVPDGVVLVEASDGGKMSPDKKTVRWNFDELDPGESRTVSVTLRPTMPGEFVTQAVATAAGGLKAQAEASTAVEGITALQLELLDLADPIEVGKETTYEIRVVNQGTQAATNITIQATAPKGMKPVKADGPVSYEISGQDIIFEPIKRLGVRADAAYHIRVRGESPGDHRFKVKLHCDQLESFVNKEESTRVYADE